MAQAPGNVRAQAVERNSAPSANAERKRRAPRIRQAHTPDSSPYELVRMRETNGGDNSTGAIATVGVAFAVGLGVYGTAQSNDDGPIIAGAVAIVVAFITWFATDRRQANALAAERERLDAQLAHERTLADIADLRIVAQAVLAANHMIWSTSLELLGIEGLDRERVLLRLQQHISDLQRALDALHLRLPPNHPLITTTGELFQALNRARKAARDSDRGGFDAQSEDHSVAHRNFVAAAVDVIGSRIEAPRVTQT